MVSNSSPTQTTQNSLVVQQHVGRIEVEAGGIGFCSDVAVHAGQLSETRAWNRHQFCVHSCYCSTQQVRRCWRGKTDKLGAQVPESPPVWPCSCLSSDRLWSACWSDPSWWSSLWCTWTLAALRMTNFTHKQTKTQFISLLNPPLYRKTLSGDSLVRTSQRCGCSFHGDHVEEQLDLKKIKTQSVTTYGPGAVIRTKGVRYRAASS